MTLSVQSTGIPAELRERPQWVCWRIEARGGKSTKIPHQVNGQLAKSDDSETWSTCDAALAAYERGGFAGVGFVFSPDDELIGIDLDGCRDQATGAIEEWAQQLIAQAGTYAEVSPSGSGVKIFGRGTLPGGKGKRHDLGNGKRIELYDRGRYFAVTGHVLPCSPSALNDCQATIDELWQRYFATPIGQHFTGPTMPATNGAERCRRYVEKMPPAISGQGGHNATFAVACELFRFGLADGEAWPILLEYNQRCLPPWSENELRHKLDDGRKEIESKGELGSRLRDQLPIVPLAGARIEAAVKLPELPPEMFRVPGFISEVMDTTLAASPYPNVPLAFCGALALQSFLAGRKIRDDGDCRPNVYVLALAYSGSGKDHPRRVNSKIVGNVGLSDCIGETFASAEGLQDSLFVTPSMLFQTDEFDTLIQAINKSSDARYEGLLAALLTYYTSSASAVPMRRRAGQPSGASIDQPNLVFFATATPSNWYAACSERLLTNGLISRLLVIEAARRGTGQDAKIIEVPTRVMETARWWAEFRPGSGNLREWHPVPAIVEYDTDAKQLARDTRADCDGEYAKAEHAGDAVATTIWARVAEQSRKLSLLWAASENHASPRVTKAAVEWSTRLSMHQARRTLASAANRVAANPFHADCLRALQKLREAPDLILDHSILLKRMKLGAERFRQVMGTLAEQGDVMVIPTKTRGRDGITYGLAV